MGFSMGAMEGVDDHLVALGAVSQVDSGAKLFLVRWIQHYGVEQLIDVPMKQIAIDLAVSDRLVAKAVRSLIVSGFIERTLVDRAGPGRPRWSYRCTATLTRCMEVPPGVDLEVCHRARIEKLLEPTEGQFGKAAKARLDRSDRLLL